VSLQTSQSLVIIGLNSLQRLHGLKTRAIDDAVDFTTIVTIVSAIGFTEEPNHNSYALAASTMQLQQWTRVYHLA